MIAQFIFSYATLVAIVQILIAATLTYVIKSQVGLKRVATFFVFCLAWVTLYKSYYFVNFTRTIQINSDFPRPIYYASSVLLIFGFLALLFALVKKKTSWLRWAGGSLFVSLGCSIFLTVLEFSKGQSRLYDAFFFMETPYRPIVNGLECGLSLFFFIGMSDAVYRVLRTALQRDAGL